MAEREQFLQEIAIDPENTSVRGIFADWLEDNTDEVELADFMRSWTLEKYKEAKKYLEELAEYITQEGRDFYDPGPTYELTYEQLIEGLREGADKHTGSIYLNFDTPDRLYEHDTRIKMWEAFEMVTSRRVKEDRKTESPFRCGC
jgi:uncharacterized protein (TIGR02996 family)